MARTAIQKRLEEELCGIEVTLNKGKTKTVDLTNKESFDFLGFTYRQKETRYKKKWAEMTPKIKSRTKHLQKLKQVFRRYISRPTKQLIEILNPILRGWANYFRIGNSSRCFNYVKNWVEEKLRRHLMRNRKRKGYGWKRWSKQWLYKELRLYGDYSIRYTRQKVEAIT